MYARARQPSSASTGYTVCQPVATTTSAPYHSPKPLNTGACTGAKCSTTIRRMWAGCSPARSRNGSWTQSEHVWPIRSSRRTSWKMMLWPPDPIENGGIANAMCRRSRSPWPGSGGSSAAGPERSIRSIEAYSCWSWTRGRATSAGSAGAGAAAAAGGASPRRSSERLRCTPRGRLGAREPSAENTLRPVWCTSERPVQRDSAAPS